MYVYTAIRHVVGVCWYYFAGHRVDFGSTDVLRVMTMHNSREGNLPLVVCYHYPVVVCLGGATTAPFVMFSLVVYCT